MIQRFLCRLVERLLPFLDLSAWIMLLVAVVPLYFIDRAMLLTLAQWTIIGLAFAGLSVVICRVSFPQLDLHEWVDEARNRNPEAGKVIQSICILFGFIFVGLVLWAKA